MSQSVESPHTRPVGTGYDGSSGYAVLGRVTGAAGLVTLVAVVGTSLVNGYENQSMTEATPAIISFFRSLDDRAG